MAAMAAREVVITPSVFAGAPATSTPTIAAWHFPGAAAAFPPPISVSGAGLLFSNSQRPRFSSRAPSASEFPYSRHQPPPLPTCSPSCTDCPTSTRLLLMLHSLRLGLGADGWTRVPLSEASMPIERSRWSRICSKRRMPGGRGGGAKNAVSSSSSETRQISRSSSSGSEPMTPPFNVLITGATKGIGYALAKEFLRQGDNVIICSRSEERVEKVLKELTKEFGEHRAWGTTCDVRDGKSVKALADFSTSQVGYIDIWINNAGTNAYTYKSLVDTNDDAIAEIVTTNTLGVMLCCRQAIQTMLEQPRGGHIFNMDGAGADGNPTPRFAAYGATKRSLAQFTKSLQAELKQQGIKDVIVHNLSPGMVTTDLLMSGSDTRQAKFFINVLAEPAEEVASYLVPRIRAIPGDKNKSSKYIRFLTGFKAYTQILALSQVHGHNVVQRLIFKARKDRFVTED